MTKIDRERVPADWEKRGFGLQTERAQLGSEVVTVGQWGGRRLMNGGTPVRRSHPTDRGQTDLEAAPDHHIALAAGRRIGSEAVGTDGNLRRAANRGVVEKN